MAETGASERLEGLASRLDEFSSYLSGLGDEVRAALEGFAGEPREPSAGEPELRQVTESLQRLASGETQEEILENYLEEAQSYVSRAILFLERDGQYVTWKGFGFLPDEIRDIALEHSDDVVVRAAQQRQLIYRRDHPADAMPWLEKSGHRPESSVCIPLAFDNTVPVMFYGDSDEEVAIDSLELLTHLVVLVLKNNYLQQMAVGEGWAAGMAASAPVGSEGVGVDESEEVASLEAAEGAADAAPPLPEEAGQETEFGDESVDSLSAEPADEHEATQPMGFAEPRSAETMGWSDLAEEPLGSSGEKLDFDTPEESQAQEAVSAALREEDFTFDDASELRHLDEDASPQPPEASDESVFGSAEEAEEEVALSDEDREDVLASEPPDLTYAAESSSLESAAEEPPPLEEALDGEDEAVEEDDSSESDIRYGMGEAVDEAFSAEAEELPSVELSDEERKNHDEARRFARLLVSEIKLYNENEVEAGRQNRDLYDRLTQDIDRSREMYNKRVDADINERVDYFHQEMVRILAQGDADLMGNNYPG